jgi:hypothetical protein
MKCLRPLQSWDRGLEFYPRYGCLFVLAALRRADPPEEEEEEEEEEDDAIMLLSSVSPTVANSQACRTIC